MREIRDWGLGIRTVRRRHCAVLCALPSPLSSPIRNPQSVIPNPRRKKGTGPICAQHPSGRSGGHRPKVGWGLSPFPRRGISLLEILISIFILAVGLLGVAALIPAGKLSMMEVETADRTGACGRAGLHDVQIRGMLNNTNDFVPPGLPASSVFAIDPLGYNSGLTGPLGGNSSAVNRIGLTWANAAMAEQVFRWHDDLIFVRPEEMTSGLIPPPGTRPVAQIAPWQLSRTYTAGCQVIPTNPNGHVYSCITAGVSGATEPTWVTNGGTVSDSGVTWQDSGLGGQDAGNFSWFLTAAGTQDPSIYQVSVVVCEKRVFSTDGETMQVVNVLTNPGYGGVTIQFNGQWPTNWTLNRNNWIFLYGAGQAVWYRIAYAAYDEKNNQTIMSLVGPDWFGGAAATAVSVDGVTGVYSTTVKVN